VAAVLATIDHRPESVPPASPDGTFHLEAGTLLSGRYLIVAPLGKGGMGEVYRADDLTLGMAVALKFLPADVAADPLRLDRFRKEVAAARQVSHPHVCRVYDIAEVEGRAFLSMEFITGDDLAAVLGKAGRLPTPTAIELGRQIAQGLQAVHDEGLVHRDLKPANVMLDGRGRARLTDFGLAARADGVAETEAYAGTPAYQAPEQLTGGTITVRTDIYALGVLLYELLTGRRPFQAATRDELVRLQQARPARPSQLVAGVPAAVDRVVLRCLAPDAGDRPASAHEVWRALPGDDVLKAILDAGLTPTAQVVADAGGEGRIRRRTALALGAVVALAAVGTCLLHEQRSILRTTPVRSPAELTATARTVLGSTSPGDPSVSSACGFDEDSNQIVWRNKHDRGMDRLASLAVGRPALLRFWYRQSTKPLLPEARLGSVPLVEGNNPPRGQPGSAYVVLDGMGRLLTLECVPLSRMPATTAEPGWEPLFAAAGLDVRAFRSVPPEWDWQVPWDTRRAWTGTFPERPDLPFRVEAASERGLVVGFRLVAPWTPPPGVAGATGRTAVRDLLDLALPALLLTVGGVLALGHIRAGRADLSGAARMVAVYGAIWVGVVLFAAPHVADVSREAGLLYGAAGLVLHQAATLGLAYLALEPFVRRRWPVQLVGWARLLAGRGSDPWVGRDVLLGAAAGAVCAFGADVADSAAGWLGYPPELPLVFTAKQVGQPVLFLLSLLQSSIAQGLTFLFVLFLLARLLRSAWLWYPAILVLVLAFYVFVPVVTPWVKAVAVLPLIALGCSVLHRSGLLAFISLVLTYSILHAMPCTFDLNTWYRPATVLALGTTAAITGYGLVMSVGGWRGLMAAKVRQDD
jgi:serine/threonine-protein kinase